MSSAGFQVDTAFVISSLVSGSIPTISVKRLDPPGHLGADLHLALEQDEVERGDERAGAA